jgi:hypothetical protein
MKKNNNPSEWSKNFKVVEVRNGYEIQMIDGYFVSFHLSMEEAEIVISRL